MKLVIDENIVFAKEAFSEFGEIKLLPGRKIKNSDLRDADILIVRSVTNVDEALLKNTNNIKFVGTATIGIDHIDVNYLKNRKIIFHSAAGCNSMSVAEYVFAGILEISKKYNIALEDKSIGIIGIGNVGSKVVKIAESIGLKVVKNDPPRQRLEKSGEYSSLEEALNCDIVTFHVPLNVGGIDNTMHLMNEDNINKLKPGTILINTSRGAVINNLVLKKRLQGNKDIYTILDVWENEPEIDNELLQLTEIGTPHIAGYSFEGKMNGTKIIYDNLCNYLNKKNSWQPEIKSPTENILEWNNKLSWQSNLQLLFPRVYSILSDDRNFKKILSDSNLKKSEYFDYLRKTYSTRREFSAYKMSGNKLPQNVIKVLNSLKIKYCEPDK